jgi:sugar phosphate permease
MQLRNFIPWLIWIVAASFYSFEFFLRISPTVMVSDLMHDFAVDAAVLGNLSAFYYYAYAAMQIPAGFLLDRLGIRPLLTFAAILVAIGSFLFATTTHLPIAELGRVCMGIGSAFSFIGCLKLVRNWFSAKQLAIIIGLTNTLGVVGALTAEAPLAMMVDHWGWRQTLLIAGCIGALLALVIRVVIRDKPDNVEVRISQQDFFQSLSHVIRCSRTWLTAIYGGLMVAPIAAFTELWSVPFFMQADALTRTKAAALSSLVFIGIAVGGPLNGWLSGKLGKRKPVMLLGCLGAFLSFVLLIYAPLHSYPLIMTLLFCFGFFTSSMLLAFSINTEHNSTAVTGVVIGFTNMLVMMGGTIFQPLVGYFLDISQPGIITRYSLPEYQHALILLPLCQLGALILLFFIRETFCRKTS